MIPCLDDSRILASCAVFKSLYDNSRDINVVLQDFIKNTIHQHGMRQFTASELTTQLNEDYDFRLIDAVVSSALKTMNFRSSKQKHQVVYYCDPEKFQGQDNVASSIANETNRNRSFIEYLHKFVGDRRGRTLADDEKSRLLKVFSHFIMSPDYNGDSEWREDISAFIVHCDGDAALKSSLSRITEAVLCYEGVTFSLKYKASSKWKNELVIYLDTELLFHMAGYNGLLCQKLFEDFYTLVSEINADSYKNGGKKLITFRYFDYVKVELERFFDKAARIVRGNSLNTEGRIAMDTITQGCLTESDLLLKKTQFYTELTSRGIHPDNASFNYYADSLRQWNLEDFDIVSECKKAGMNPDPEDIKTSLQSISHIHKLRRGKRPRTLREAEYILLSERRLTRQLSRLDIFNMQGTVGLARSLYFFTNYFWYQLDKGFGMAQFPEICSAVSRARIILSAHVRKSVANCYVELQEKLNNSEITIDVAKDYIHELRQHNLYPEEVSESNLSEVEETLTMHSLADYERGIEAEKREHQQTVAENKHLRAENEHIHSVNEVYRSQIDALSGDKEQLQQALIEERKNHYQAKIATYKKERNGLVHQKVSAARRTLGLYVGVTMMSIIIPVVLSLLKTYRIEISVWLTIVISIVVVQLIALLFRLIPAADIWAAYKLAVKHRYRPLLKDFMACYTRPSYQKIFDV